MSLLCVNNWLLKRERGANMNLHSLHVQGPPRLCSPPTSYISSRSGRIWEGIQQKCYWLLHHLCSNAGAEKWFTTAEKTLRWQNLICTGWHFGWRHVFGISLICVTFCSYLYDKKILPAVSLNASIVEAGQDAVISLSDAGGWSLALTVYSLIAWLDFFVQTISSVLYSVPLYFTVSEKQPKWWITAVQQKCKEFRFVDCLLCHLVVHTCSTGVSQPPFQSSTSTTCFFLQCVGCR